MKDTDKIKLDKIRIMYGNKRHKFIIGPLDDNSGFSVWETYDDKKTAFCASFIDCGNYIASTVLTREKKLCLLLRTPSDNDIYTCTAPEAYANKMVTCTTPHGTVLNAHPSLPDYEEKCFNGVDISMEIGGKEYLVAKFSINKTLQGAYTEVFGFPAGYEVEE